jgi:hypothetical protein
VQVPSCERPKSTQRRVFLIFENNNYILLAVKCRRCMKKSGKLACHLLSSNCAINFFRSSIHRSSLGFVALFEKNVHIMHSRFLSSSHVSSEGLQHQNCSKVHCAIIVTHPDIDVAFEIKYCIYVNNRNILR